MTHHSPDRVYENLNRLDSADPVRCADYRQQAVETIADEEVSLDWREAIARRLNQANHWLALRNVDAEDSY